MKYIIKVKVPRPNFVMIGLTHREMIESLKRLRGVMNPCGEIDLKGRPVEKDV